MLTKFWLADIYSELGCESLGRFLHKRASSHRRYLAMHVRVSFIIYWGGGFKFIFRFHPDFHDRNSKIQREMMEYMSTWLQSLGNNRQEVLRRLTKQAVRNHENIRLAGQGGSAPAQGGYAQNAGVEAQHNLQGYLNQVPGMSSASAMLSKINSPGGSGGGFPSMGQAQSMLGKFGVGGGGESSGFFSREVEGAPYGGAQAQTSSYSSATMPSGGMETSYSTTSTYPGQGDGHGHAASYLSSPSQPEAYPPPIPSPSYSSGPGSAPPPPSSGYAPAYASSYGPSSYGAPEFPPVSPSYPDHNIHGGGGEHGYGGFQPPPPGPPGPPGFPGPAGFPDPYGGPPPFPGGPDQQGYPPPGGYGGPPPPNRPFGW